MKHFLVAGVAVWMGYASALAQSSPINSAFFQSITARNLGPSTMSGRITAIEGMPVDDQLTLYVGTAGGGIWKSQNGGLNFAPIFDKYNQSIGALAIEPGNAKIVYAGTGESNMRNTVSIGDGMYKSTDGGSNWQKIGLDSTEHISKIWIDPQDKKRILVAVPGPLWSSSAHRGLYQTTDGGKNWTKALFVDNETGCADIAVNPANPQIMLASFWQVRRKPYAFASGGPGSALYRSTDGGKTWAKVSNGFPEGPLGRTVVTINPSKPAEVLAIVEAKTPGLYASSDEGNSWKKLAATNNITARPFYFSTLVFDPKDPKRVYRPAFDFQYSNDGGVSWSNTIVGGVAPHADHHALFIHPTQPNVMFLGTDGGVYATQNRGVSWSFLNNLPVGQFYHVSTDNKNPYHVYGGLQDNGSWFAPGSKASGINSTDWKNLYGGDGFWVVTNPFDANIAFAESQGGDVARINLATGLSSSIRPQPSKGDETHRWNWNTPIVTIASSVKKPTPVYNLYTANQYLYRSQDEGRSWQRISPDLTTNDSAKLPKPDAGGITGDNTSAENHCTIFTLAQQPKNDNEIWVGTDDGNLQVTTDGGKTWINKSPNIWKAGVPKGAWISSIELSKINAKRIFVTLENHMYGDHATYAVVSNDGGNTWKKFASSEFTGFAHVLREDPANEKLLFLGTEMGLFISIDAGNTWMRSKYQGIPWYALVRDMVIEPKTNDLVIATHGRGIFIIDDLTTLRNLASADLQQAELVFPTKPFVYNLQGPLPTGSDNLSGWAASGAVDLPTISYYLKDKSADAVKVEIFDANNVKIKDFNGTSLKGLNQVYWPLNINPPKVAAGGFTAGSNVYYSGIVAPRVKPGTYKAVLNINGKKLSQPLVVLPNPALGFSDAKLTLLYNQSMQAYVLHEQLAALVDSINGSIESLKKVASATAAQTTQLAALQAMRPEILELTRTTVFYDEFKFRRRVSDVYMQLMASTEPLTPGQANGILLLQQEFEGFRKQYYKILKG
ncbi:MAG: glycosyl hydrolase [Bacteroidetes bacterium]|nr:MAG: glycosyl hydrolase [Bacteroidota bacterium]